MQFKKMMYVLNLVLGIYLSLFSLSSSADLIFNDNSINVPYLAVGDSAYSFNFDLYDAESLSFQINLSSVAELSDTATPANASDAIFEGSSIIFTRLAVDATVYYVKFDLIDADQYIFQLNASSIEIVSNTASVSGTWAILADINAQDCDEGVYSEAFNLSILQFGNSLTVSDSVRNYYGNISGNSLYWSGNVEEDGGITSSSINITFDADSDTLTGSSSWFWSNGLENCSGTTSLSGSLLSTPSGSSSPEYSGTGDVMLFQNLRFPYAVNYPAIINTEEGSIVLEAAGQFGPNFDRGYYIDTLAMVFPDGSYGSIRISRDYLEAKLFSITFQLGGYKYEYSKDNADSYTIDVEFPDGERESTIVDSSEELPAYDYPFFKTFNEPMIDLVSSAFNIFNGITTSRYVCPDNILVAACLEFRADLGRASILIQAAQATLERDSATLPAPKDGDVTIGCDWVDFYKPCNYFIAAQAQTQILPGLVAILNAPGDPNGNGDTLIWGKLWLWNDTDGIRYEQSGKEVQVEYEGGVTGANPISPSPPATNWRDAWKDTATGRSLLLNDYAPANTCVITPSTPGCCQARESKAKACGI